MSLIPLLTQIAIPLGIKFVNAILNKPQSGAEKKNLLTQILDAVIQKLQALNLTTDPHPGSDVLSGLIEGIFAPMKASGAENAPISAQEIYILQGAGIKLTKIG